jgi:hypothetical protein
MDNSLANVLKTKTFLPSKGIISFEVEVDLTAADP